jgi:hypothetical protein
LLQITSSFPWRRTILQFSQIRFTLARTFIAMSPSREKHFIAAAVPTGKGAGEKLSHTSRSRPPGCGTLWPRVIEVHDYLLIVEHRSEPGRQVLLVFKGHKLAVGSVIKDFTAVSKSGLFIVSGPYDPWLSGRDRWLVEPHNPEPPPPPPAPKPTPPPPPKVEPKVESKDDAIGMLTARNKAAELKGKRVKITGIVSSWEASGGSITLTFRSGGSRVCEITLSGDQRKKVPGAVPESKWRITIDAEGNGMRDGLLSLSDVKVISVEK